MKNFILLVFFTLTSQLSSSQVLNPGRDDGRRPVTPSQTAPNVIKPNTTKPYVIMPSKGLKPIVGSNHFKSIVLNTRNGGVWLIDENDMLRGTHFHYQNLGTATITDNSKVENLTADRYFAFCCCW